MNNNQTVVVNYFQEMAQGSLTAYKGKEIKSFQLRYTIFVGLSTSDTSSDPALSVKNLLRCRADSILSFNVGRGASNGAIFAMDIYPYSGGPSPQTLFSIRDGSTNLVPFVAELSDSTGSTSEITFYRKDSSGSLIAVATPSLTMTKGNFYVLM